jgi:twinkle protein
MIGGKVKKERKDVLIQTMDDVLGDMLYDLENGKEKGSTTYITELDKCWKWRKGECNIWSGYANEGKSLILRYLCIVKAIMEGWNFLFCAPEDYPAKEFYDDMIHTITGFPTDKDHPMCVSKELYLEAVQMIKDRIHFIYLKPPKNSIQETLDQFQLIIDDMNIDGVILDPLLKFTRPEQFMSRDDLYAAYIGGICMDFARVNNVSLHLVMHQLTPEFDMEGYYKKPSMYRIKGGGSWADGFDNIISIWRPKYAKDKKSDEVMFSTQKIKKQKLVGIPQDIMMRLNRKTNRYIDYNTHQDLFDFDKFF